VCGEGGEGEKKSARNGDFDLTLSYVGGGGGGRERRKGEGTSMAFIRFGRR